MSGALGTHGDGALLKGSCEWVPAAQSRCQATCIQQMLCLSRVRCSAPAELVGKAKICQVRNCFQPCMYA